MSSITLFSSKSVSAQWVRPARPGQYYPYQVRFPNGDVRYYATADKALKAASRAARRIGETSESK